MTRDDRPHPYNCDPSKMLMTSGDHSYISICGEWVRLPLEEVNRLTKKWRQAREIRLQVEAELKNKKALPAESQQG